MSAAEAPFVAEIRSRPGTLRLANPGEQVITVRVHVPEVWDTLRCEVSPETSVSLLKQRALEILLSDAVNDHEYVVKIMGREVLEESAPLSAVGVRDGSTLLVTSRRRRPVR
jgi:hypothetical protein